MIFAERSAGRAVAVHPTVISEHTEEHDCNNMWPLRNDEDDVCVVEPPYPTGVPELDKVHEQLVDVSRLYKDNFGWLSWDGHDDEIEAHTRLGVHYGNAYFTCNVWDLQYHCWMSFGSGDGICLRPLVERDVGTWKFYCMLQQLR
jgi:Zn-dependent metalloprotease